MLLPKYYKQMIDYNNIFKALIKKTIFPTHFYRHYLFILKEL